MRSMSELAKIKEVYDSRVSGVRKIIRSKSGYLIKKTDDNKYSFELVKKSDLKYLKKIN